MQLRSQLISLFFVFCSTLYAQTDFRPGLIITLSGDTIEGMIDYRGDILMSNQCKFMNGNNETTLYFPHELAAFQFNNGKYFVSKKLETGQVFLEFLIKGVISIYYNRDSKGDHYYIEKNGEKIVEIPYEEGIKTIDDKEVYFESTRHVGILNYYMQDAPGFQERVSKIKKPGHGNLILLAEDYHKVVCSDEQCIVFERELPFVRIIPEFSLGLTFIPEALASESGSIQNAGIIGHIWMPRTNEKLYLRTGMEVLFQVFPEVSNTIMLLFPLHIEYIYPQGKIRPRFAYGPTITIPSIPIISFEAGLNMQVSESFYLNLSAELHTISKLIIIPQSILYYNFKLGLLYNL